MGWLVVMVQVWSDGLSSGGDYYNAVVYRRAIANDLAISLYRIGVGDK